MLLNINLNIMKSSSTMSSSEGSPLTEPLVGDSDEEAAGDLGDGQFASTVTSKEPPPSKWL